MNLINIKQLYMKNYLYINNIYNVQILFLINEISNLGIL